MKLRKPLKGQLAAMVYTERTKHPALFMPMRTGKCLPTIRTILQYSPRNPRLGLRVLVIGPVSALPGWEDELAAEGVGSVILLNGSRKRRLQRLQTGTEWCLLNKEGVHVVPEVTRCHWMEWDAVVVDESASLRDPRTLFTQRMLRSFRDVPHRWILTGEPHPESLLDIWCQMAFLDRKPLGHSSYWSFRNKRFQEGARSYKWEPMPGTDQLVVDYLAARTFIISKEEAGLEDREVYERRTLALPARYRKIYETIEKEYLIEVDDKVIAKTMSSGARWQWLQQLCGGFLQHEMVWDGKVKALVNLLRTELAKEQVVIWFNYNQELHACVKAISRVKIPAKVLVGATPKPLRGGVTKAFNRREFRVLLAQEAVASEGVDLSGASVQMFFSNFPGLLRRAECRARLEHPTRKESFLTIDFCTADTVNEDIARLLADKEWNSQAVFNRAVRARMRRRAA